METIPPLAALAALISAMAHAGFAIYTRRADDILTFRAVAMGMTALWLSPVLILSPLPDWEVWRFLLIGVGLFWAYNMAMIAAFKRGDMNLVYPVMRGAAPAIAGVFAIVFLGEQLSLIAILGLSVASAALIAFAWPEKGGRPKAAALGFALTTALMTASYTVNDAAGVRAADSPLVYAAWIFLLCFCMLTLTAFIRRGPALFSLARAQVRSAFPASFLNLASYGLALFAFAHAPVAPVAALRETSVVFGALLAALILKEPLGVRRIALAVVLALGLAAIQLG